MPHQKRSHADARKVVCAICMSKSGNDLRNISHDIGILIQQFVFPDFDKNNENLVQLSVANVEKV